MWAVPFRDQKADGDPVLVKQGLGRFYPLGFSNDGRYHLRDAIGHRRRLLRGFRRGETAGSPAKPGSSRPDGTGRTVFRASHRMAGVSPSPPSAAPTLSRCTGRMRCVRSSPLKEPAGDPVIVGFEEFGLTQVMGPCWLADGKAIVLGGYGQEHALYRVDLPSLKTTEATLRPARGASAARSCVRW